MAARFVDAIARFPGMDGEDSDATGAYTQTVLGEDCPETWVSLPRDRHPKSWYNADGSCKYDNPVVRLVRNLYGHPLAGLYWQKFCDDAVRKVGFEPVVGWECLYKHSADGLILSIYVDDFKLGGRKDKLAPMWKQLGGYLKLDPPQKLHDNVYLGMKQRECTIDPELIAEKNKLYHIIFDGKGYTPSGIEIPTAEKKGDSKKKKKKKAAADQPNASSGEKAAAGGAIAKENNQLRAISTI